jgi:putative hydroxymethylpyrimidine transport system permease protein
MKRALQALPAVLLLLALIGVWELYVDLKGPTFSLILPPPHAVVKSLYTDRSLLWSSFLVTAQEVLLGILVATVFGFLLAIAIHFSLTLRRATYPLAVASQAVPVAVFAPVLAFWLGYGILPKLVVVAVVSFFSIVVTTTKIAVAVSVIGAVFAEYTGSNSGLGYVILVSEPQLLVARAVAAVVILSLFAIALFALLALAERLALPWAYRAPEERTA